MRCLAVSDLVNAYPIKIGNNVVRANPILKPVFLFVVLVGLTSTYQTLQLNLLLMTKKRCWDT